MSNISPPPDEHDRDDQGRPKGDRPRANGKPKPMDANIRRQLVHKMASKEEVDAIGQCCASAEAAHPYDLNKQFAALWQSIRIPAATGRARPASFRTEKAYRDCMKSLVHTLLKLNMRPAGICKFTIKQVRHAFHHWESEGKSAATLQNRYCIIRRFYLWIGQPAFPPLGELLKSAESAKRKTSVTESKSWAARGIDAEEVIARVKQRCSVTAMHLLLQLHFGLRVQESLCLCLRESDAGAHLLINRGTKGGRGRLVPVDSAVRQQVLQEAKAMADPQSGLIKVHPRYTLARARNHYYYVMRQEGITYSALGISSHGLRHQFSAEHYVQATGALPPVEGGNLADRALELATRASLTQALGHSRLQVTTAYIGSVQQMRRVHVRKMVELVRLIEHGSSGVPGLHGSALQAAAAAGFQLRLHMLDDRSPGSVLHGPGASALVLAVQVEPQLPMAHRGEVSQAMPDLESALRTLENGLIEALGRALDTQVVVVKHQHVRPDKVMIELFAPAALPVSGSGHMPV